jgi:hypothetical protein
VTESPAEPPTIEFGDFDGDTRVIRIAYLVWVDDHPWAYIRLEDVHLPAQSAGAIPLDPLRIVKGTPGQLAKDRFLYRAAP